MTIALKPRPLVKLRKYPHMEPLDTAIWNAYLDLEPWPNALVEYDVHVGTTATVPLEAPESYRRMVEHLSSLRIDVAVFLPHQTLIIEIKPSASLSAIGQALGYTHLFHAKYPHCLKPTPCILTDVPKPDTLWLCNLLNVKLRSLDRAITQ